MKSWNGLRMRKVYEKNFDNKERIWGTESQRKIAEWQRNCDSFREKLVTPE
jgi:hypothetical protein